MSKTKEAPSQEASESTVVPPHDARLKIPLRTSAPKFRTTKADLERLNGRPLTHDEAMNIILGFVNIDAGDTVVVAVTTSLKQLARDLQDHRQEALADAVELFRECLIDVIRGRVPIRRLTEAIENVG